MQGHLYGNAKPMGRLLFKYLICISIFENNLCLGLALICECLCMTERKYKNKKNFYLSHFNFLNATN